MLIDAFSPDSHGGTGKRIDPAWVEKARGCGPLWLAGGITPENVRGILEAFRPELIDISSGLEERPGLKDAAKTRKFFEEIRHYESIQ